MNTDQFRAYEAKLREEEKSSCTKEHTEYIQ